MRWRHGAAWGVGGWLLTTLAAAGVPTFELTLSPTICGEPFTGRVYVLSSRRHEPRNGPDWFQPEPFLARDVVDWRPGQTLHLAADDSDVLTFPRDFSTVDLDGARVQAVARLNPRERKVGTGSGNGFSQAAVVSGDSPIALTIDHVVPERKFAETRWSRLLKVTSQRLSEFYGHEVSLRACVTLPASYYDRPERHYPVIFIIPGFGGTHLHGRRTQPVEEHNLRGVEFLRVTLDPSCPLGHHVFADSANNGPVGRALVDELIPALNLQYRTIDDSRARFLTGHSSGGWSSLWLQVRYPETFGGVWSTAPDPVDFRDFQRIDLYQTGVNMYEDDQGHRRPLAIVDGQVHIWYDDFDRMEEVLGPGGQLHSFEAVFSPRGADTRPRPLWDRRTGLVDTDVARSWEAYDIRLVLERNWRTLAPLLAGRIHIFMGSKDTFLLDGAARLLKDSLERLGSDAVVEIHEGKNHGTLMTPQLRERIRREMTTTFLAAFPDWPAVAADQ